MLLAIVLLAQVSAATASPAPATVLTPDQKIEAAAAAIVADDGRPLVERIDWSEDTAAPPGTVQQLRIYMAPVPWHRMPRSLKRDAVDRLVRLDWRTSSWAGRSAGEVYARIYVGETFLGRIEVRNRYDGSPDDRFRPGRAWADQ